MFCDTPGALRMTDDSDSILRTLETWRIRLQAVNLAVTFALLSLVDDVRGDHQLVIVVRWLAVQHPPHVSCNFYPSFATKTI